jgi:hypothetical protein
LNRSSCHNWGKQDPAETKTFLTNKEDMIRYAYFNVARCMFQTKGGIGFLATTCIEKGMVGLRRSKTKAIGQSSEKSGNPRESPQRVRIHRMG